MILIVYSNVCFWFSLLYYCSTEKEVDHYINFPNLTPPALRRMLSTTSLPTFEYDATAAADLEEEDELEPWSFTVVADPHNFMPFSYGPSDASDKRFATLKEILSNIKQNYNGGEVVLMPGDGVSYGGQENTDIAENLGGDLPKAEAVYQASRNCHQRTRDLFRSAGFDHVLPTVGDHEIGGMWLSCSFKENRTLYS